MEENITTIAENITASSSSNRGVGLEWEYECYDLRCTFLYITPITVIFAWTPVYIMHRIVQGYQAQKFVEESQSSWVPLAGEVEKKSVVETGVLGPICCIKLQCEVEGKTLQMNLAGVSDGTYWETQEGQSEELVYFPGYPLSATPKGGIEETTKGGGCDVQALVFAPFWLGLCKRR
jgi:hypothetical protein